MPTISIETISAYANCPRKSFLIMQGKKGKFHEYTKIIQKHKEKTENNYLDHLRDNNKTIDDFITSGLLSEKEILTNVILESDNLIAENFLLHKIKDVKNYHEPIWIIGTYKIEKQHRLILHYIGHILSKHQDVFPKIGWIITPKLKARKVKLNDNENQLFDALESIKTWSTSSVEPPTHLNKHCQQCQFQKSCKIIAERENNLSLIGLNSKQIRKYETKGIFTVKQIAYLYKPRKRKKRSKNPPPIIHKPELRALAIRDQKIYIEEVPEIVREPIELYLDVEGLPDLDFYYQIGIVTLQNGESNYHVFWANTISDEESMWRKCYEFLRKHPPDTPIYHYGHYDARALHRLINRYSNNTNDSSEYSDLRLINVSKLIYGKVYYPTYSNKLKEIGVYLGLQWSNQDSSGLRSIVWRMLWEASKKEKYKNLITVYNYEDCRNLNLVVDNLTMSLSSVNETENIDFASNFKQDQAMAESELAYQLKKVLEFSYFGYDKNKIVFQKQEKKDKKITFSKKGYQGQRKIKPKVQKTVQVTQGEHCPKCGCQLSLSQNYISKRLIIDLKLTSKGIKKTIIHYVGYKDYCRSCGAYYAPPDIRKYAPMQLYGHKFMSFIAYHRVALKLPYSHIAEMIKEQFNETLPVASFSGYIRKFASYYTNSEEQLLQQLLKSPFIHADETTVSVLGINWYVWVFTDEKYVIFKLRETRESSIVHDFFNSYEGVVISDFYSAYNSLNCKQQKCWVHLIRDMNTDLLSEPSDFEYQTFVNHTRDLLIPIMKTIQKYGLKKWYLNKFKKEVDKFYKKAVNGILYKSDLTRKYQNRFLKNRDSLFTFLEQDGIPWHNNAAERAIRPLAKQRTISSSFSESVLTSYLLLLGLRQTCVFQKKSFFKFLFSGETNLDLFQKSRTPKKH